MGILHEELHIFKATVTTFYNMCKIPNNSNKNNIKCDHSGLNGMAIWEVFRMRRQEYISFLVSLHPDALIQQCEYAAWIFWQCERMSVPERRLTPLMMYFPLQTEQKHYVHSYGTHVLRLESDSTHQTLEWN